MTCLGDLAKVGQGHLEGPCAASSPYRDVSPNSEREALTSGRSHGRNLAPPAAPKRECSPRLGEASGLGAMP